MSHVHRTSQNRSAVAMLALAALMIPTMAHAQQGAMMAPDPVLVQMAPARGFLAAHAKVTKPLGLLGGPIHITIRQDAGGVFVSLPDKRKLDENVFGTPEHPRAFAGSPIINGVPENMREQANGKYTTISTLSPFGDMNMVLPDGKLDLKLTDATATDAAMSDDKVDLTASWKDKDGNTYTVRCCTMVLAHGLEYPTFGGVVTNHLLHGFTRLGTGLMPTEFSYAAFWGMGEVQKNGTTIDSNRLIHGMLTEYVRTDGYALATDAEVTPTRMQFHLMVPPVMPDMAAGHFMPSPVTTGMTLPNGMALPFWHVMFENLTTNATRGTGS